MILRRDSSREQTTVEPIYASTTALAAIRAGNLSATAVLEAHLAQIARHNPALNAIVTTGRRWCPHAGA